jgi:hypothetical protein
MKPKTAPKVSIAKVDRLEKFPAAKERTLPTPVPSNVCHVSQECMKTKSDQRNAKIVPQINSMVHPQHCFAVIVVLGSFHLLAVPVAPNVPPVKPERPVLIALKANTEALMTQRKPV